MRNHKQRLRRPSAAAASTYQMLVAAEISHLCSDFAFEAVQLVDLKEEAAVAVVGLWHDSGGAMLPAFFCILPAPPSPTVYSKVPVRRIHVRQWRFRSSSAVRCLRMLNSWWFCGSL